MARIHTPDSISKLLNELKESYNKSNFLYQPILTSGYFDILHSAHIKYLEASSRYGNIWITALNDNECCIRKKGFFLLDEKERAAVVGSLSCIHYVVIWPKDDVSELIELVKPSFFLNGGDRTVGNSNEERACRQVKCKPIYGVGGSTKTQSSTNILNSFLARFPMVDNKVAGNK